VRQRRRHDAEVGQLRIGRETMLGGEESAQPCFIAP
jgi:hypothetical protein